MKTLITLLAAAAIFASPALHAQQQPGSASTNSTSTSTASWAVGVIGVAAIVTVGAIAGTYSSTSPASFSH